MYRLLVYSALFFQGTILCAQSTQSRPPRVAPDLPEVLKLQMNAGNYSPTGLPLPKGLRSKEEWRTIIDSTWDDGLSVEVQLNVFDSVWTQISSSFACFQGLLVDWDEIRLRYRPEIEAGITRGRFASILNHMVIPLRESHTKVFDDWVHRQTMLGPGVPLLCVGAWGNNLWFGAALTPLPDRTLLVYKAVASHPLGLVPGDIVLGYEGVLWQDLYPQLIEAELPVAFGWWGSCPSAWEHSWLMAAGMNWHLFSTIDVLKATGETVHLATSPLVDRMPDIFNSEQLPVPGVTINSLQQIYGGDVVSWGVVDGTQIGYIYVWGWYGTAGEEFLEAVRSLMFDQETTGLIVDFRTNYGGNMFLSYDALNLLYDELVWTIDWVYRDDPEDRTSVRHAGVGESYRIEGAPDSFYDKPIAVLTGPGALSSGDQVALRFRFHPNSRFFGKPTTAAFNSPRQLEFGEFKDRWSGRYAGADAYLLSRPDQHLTHTPLEVDEDVWLMPSDVREGRDTVVQAAIDWIDGVTMPERLHFAHFGEGADVLRSKVILLSPDPSIPIAGRLKLFDSDGNPLGVDLAGHRLKGQIEARIKPHQLWSGSTDGLGQVLSGSLTVWSDEPLDGVVLFGGRGGLAGIPAAPAIQGGFLVPVMERRVLGIETGVAVTNLQDETQQLNLELLDSAGQVLAVTQFDLPPLGHIALHNREFDWKPAVDLTSFLGTIRATCPGKVAATVLQIRPGEIAALPVLSQESDATAGSSPGLNEHELYFAHFGEGGRILSSELLLLNPSPDLSVDVEVEITDKLGLPLKVDLNGKEIDGVANVSIPPNGISSLATDGLGSTVSGSVRVRSTSPVSGVVLYGGSSGVAGVGSSEAITSGFRAAVEMKEEGNPFAATNYLVRTGIALMNLESDKEVQLTCELFNSEGKRLNSASLTLAPNGHLARYLDELEWERPFTYSELLGTVQFDSSGGRISATVLRSEPGQLATLPVTALRSAR